MLIDAISEELFQKLKTLDNDRDFVVGAMSYARKKEDRMKLLEYIKTGKDVTAESVLLMALYLHQEATKRTN